jgi:hypothetical protein
VADRRSAPAKRPGRLRRWFERVVLSVAIGTITWVLERRLRKALGRASRRRSDDLTAELRH